VEEITMSLAEEMLAVQTLHGLGEAHLQKLVALARPKECPAGAILFREGDNSTSVFFLLSGEVSLEVRMRDRGPAAIYAAGPGELLGWSPLLGRHAMTATAKVTTPSRLAVLEVARLNELIEQDLHFGVAFLKQLALFVSDRLGATRHCLASVREAFESPRFTALREGSD
jgi:CRP-like cAMP-binding protein